MYDHIDERKSVSYKDISENSVSIANDDVGNDKSLKSNDGMKMSQKHLCHLTKIKRSHFEIQFTFLTSYSKNVKFLKRDLQSTVERRSLKRLLLLKVK